MIELQIKADADKLFKRLNDVQRRQLPFALSKALNDTGEDIRLEGKRTLRQEFQIRNNYVPSGMRKTNATKSNLECEIGNIRPFMKEQEFGGTKKPSKGSRVAVPSSARPSWPSIVPRRLFPSALARKESTFYRRTKGGKLAMFVRTGKGHYAPIRVMWTFHSGAKIEARWGFGDSSEKVARDRGQKHFVRAMRSAFESAR